MTNRFDRRSVLIGAAMTAAAASAARSASNGAPNRLPTPTEPVPVAFLMDQGATMIDFAGPWEAFQDAIVGRVPGFMNYTVAPEKKLYDTSGRMVRSAGAPNVVGLKFMPDYTFDDAPQPKVVVMGAQMAMQDPRKLEWLRKVEPGADILLSVCTGAFILAATGLLDGKSATTHHNYYEAFARAYPKVQLVRGRRFVDNGKLITSGGLTSGVDGALHVVSRYYGEEVAAKAAAYMEHDGEGWRTGARAAT